MLARAALRKLAGASVGAVPPATAAVLSEKGWGLGGLEFVVQPSPSQFSYGAELEAVEELSEPQGRPFSLACPPLQTQVKYREGFAFVESASPGSAPPVLAK